MKWNLDLAKKLYLRFSVIWGIKLTNQYPTIELIDMWAHDWYEGLLGIEPKDIRTAIEYCRSNLEWPPSLAEFRMICEKSLNIPDAHECLELATRRDFAHPIVKDIFEKVGDWDMRHGTRTELLKRFERLHKEFTIESRMEKIKEAKQLDCNRPKLVHISTQGSVNDERKHITRNPSDRTHLRKVEDYLL